MHYVFGSISSDRSQNGVVRSAHEWGGPPYGAVRVGQGMPCPYHTAGQQNAGADCCGIVPLHALNLRAILGPPMANEEENQMPTTKLTVNMKEYNPQNADG